jgi:putative DNA primase/helicase
VAQQGLGELVWRSKWPPKLSLYGLDRLAARPDLPTLTVFGERKCRWAAPLLAEFFVVVSSAGGDAALRKKMDLEPLVACNIDNGID